MVALIYFREDKLKKLPSIGGLHDVVRVIIWNAFRTAINGNHMLLIYDTARRTR